MDILGEDLINGGCFGINTKGHVVIAVLNMDGTVREGALLAMGTAAQLAFVSTLSFLSIQFLLFFSRGIWNYFTIENYFATILLLCE